jgi:nucleotide-binding universal stress UspA family protein
VVFPIRKILCPTDFSEPSYEGIRTAAELARLFEAVLLVSHIVSPPPIMSGIYSPTGPYHPKALKELENKASRSLKTVSEERIPLGICVQTRVIVGTPAQEITKTAIAENVDIIVIATHGQSGWKKLIMGSVTERVVRLADRPVLTIHSEEKT